MLISLLFTDPIIFFMLAGALVISLTIHEFAHAYASTKLGDYTAKYLGRLTLNPTSHLDPIGTLLLLVAGFGWGKPVPFNPINLENPKRDAALIAVAGPVSNFILAVIFALLIHVTGATIGYDTRIAEFFYLIVFYNLLLGVFNLIPLHPLDGFKVFNGLLPDSLSYQWMQMAPYGIFILLFLVFTDSIITILNPLIGIFLAVLGL